MTTALYRRYRPDSFVHVIGQEHVTDPLRAALRANKVTHAYLFSGPRGCGKTTSARILARCLNCTQGPTDTPCGECDSCRELATGGPGSLDVVEIDAASHGGVDDARELRERATFAPVRDRYKVFIIDEAHMVTPQGFNALLKLVEEPPEHVKFVFATTEPDRVLGTIRSRTHHYPFRLVPPDALEPYLAQLSQEEGIEVAPGVLNLVIRAGGGSVRDTLSVLDQLMAGTVDGTLSYHQAVALLGYTDSALLDETVDALAGGDGAAVYRVVERMVESGHDPRRFVEDLLQRLRDLLIISVAGDGAVDVLGGTPAVQLERMITQARNWGPRHLSRAADLTDHALRSMVGATSPRLQLELLIGRILVPASRGHSTADPSLPGTVGMVGGGAPHEADAHSSSAQSGSDGRRFGAAQAREELRRKRQAEAAAPPPETSRKVQAPTPEHSEEQSGAAAGAPPASITRTWTDVTAAVPGSGMGGTPVDTSTLEYVHQPNTTANSSGDSSSASRDFDMLRQRWPEVIERLSSISRVAWSLLRGNGQLGGVDGTTAVVLLPTEGMVENFIRGNRSVDVERAIHEATGLTLSVTAQVGQASGGAQVTTPSVAMAPEAAVSEPKAPASTPEEVSVSANSFRVEPDQAQASTAIEAEASTDLGWPELVMPPGSPRKDDPSDSASEYDRDPFAPAPSALDPFSQASPQALAAWSEPVAVIPNDESSMEESSPASSGWPEIAVEAGPHNLDRAGRTAHSTVHAQDEHDWRGQGAEETRHSSENSWPSSSVAGMQVGASSVFGDEVYGDQATGKTSANEGHAQSAGFTRPRLSQVEGSVGAPTSSLADSDIHAATSSPSPEFDTHPLHPAGSNSHLPSDAPASSFDAASAAAPSRPQVSAAEDDSASIDDVDVENSQSYGLPAVFEILGGKVIEEKTTEGGW